MTFHRCQRFLMPRNVASSPLWLECRKRSTAGYLLRYRKLLLSLHRNRLYLARPFCLLCSGPNITGTFAASYYIYRQVFDATGVFTETLHGGTDGNSDGHSQRNAGITFNASKGNSIYQGATVQSPALQALIIIKVWRAAGWTVLLEYVAHDALAENRYSGRLPENL